jgi:sialate O-acetylesterase
VAEFSAVGYFFARTLQQDLHVPIGIVNASWGGTHAETWMSRAALADDPDFTSLASDFPDTVQAWSREHARRAQAQIARWQPGLDPQGDGGTNWFEPGVDDSGWPSLMVPKYWEQQGLDDFDGMVWFRRSVELDARQAAQQAVLNLGAIDDCDETWLNGVHLGGQCGWDRPRNYAVPPGVLRAGGNVIAVRVTDTGAGGGFHGDAARVSLQLGDAAIALAGNWKARIEKALDKPEPLPNDMPTLLFNGMVHPITPLRIRGVIWYQGETNVPRAAQYASTFPRLIGDWRHQWQQGDFPFYFVQLAAFLPLESNSLAGSPWAELRDAQRQATALPHTGMVVATDVGDAHDIHPRNKQAIGWRLALQALRKEYGRAITSDGPVPSGLEVAGHQAILRFQNAPGGLVAKGTSGVLRGFAIAGADGQFQPAMARLQGERVLLSSDAVPEPRHVRFGWVDNPEQNNLYNRAGLPASPFRTDALPLTTQGVKFPK